MSTDFSTNCAPKLHFKTPIF